VEASPTRLADRGGAFDVVRSASFGLADATAMQRPARTSTGLDGEA
jgi:hypothetical protein